MDLVLDDDVHLEEYRMKRKPNMAGVENVTGQLALIGEVREGWIDHRYTAIVSHRGKIVGQVIR